MLYQIISGRSIFSTKNTKLDDRDAGTLKFKIKRPKKRFDKVPSAAVARAPRRGVSC